LGHALPLWPEVEASLTRLGIDVIDLYQIHWPAWTSGGPDEGIEEALGLLARLRDAGKIRAIGVSNFDVPQLRRALTVTPITSLQPPYSAAIAWTLRQPAVTGVIVGARKPDQVDDLLGAAAFRLSVEELVEVAPLLPEESAANVPEPA
jgi:aryl-alcohol dehydrogenase-like predicted oxidoreductase